jgi:hypothetical protein
VEADSVAEEIAEPMLDWSTLSANDGVDTVSDSRVSVSTPLLAKRLKIGETVACCFFPVMKGEEVVIERDFERKEVDGEVIARNADRRMRCLVIKYILARIPCRDGLLAHIVADCPRIE